MQGLLLVISGPSGAGKGTICRALREKMPEVGYSISATTRPPRPGEKDGESYFFLDRERFLQMLKEGAFLEWAEVYGELYGTPRKPVEEALARGQDIILEIDTQGAAQVKRYYPEGVFIFIVPPSYSELEKRIKGRGTESPAAIKDRLAWVKKEMAQLDLYDYVVINDQVEEAVAKIQAIIIAEKCRTKRLKKIGWHQLFWS
ncbi:guanylate kinase [Thermanaeromonas toyohensis ToBE]|uniref:Guanylate kinase n=1 Tax=Thermanaeromonas toyohensis ToBE TaxID=698762 RepID=A0A1W1VMH7_9FIRM|nr:guanylate kinase [Thermanaeromonas toyohensis]SMB94579.1 guanylate kinase [Thermanaeromonas toyohensis ToBE]